jgi:uncharacterized metal-binding protein YceD (DUF177 family)
VRCDCCNRLLSDYEATLRHAVTNEFINTCNRCLDGLEIPTRGRPDLNPYEQLTEEDVFDDEDVEDDS